MGTQVHEFIQKHSIVHLNFVASHGHTVLHQPDKALTVQIGNPAALCAKSKQTVIADFRSLDVALGGQGAPLVPIGDKLLFKDYDFCLNLGGIANISYESNERGRLAFDNCPMNIALNHLASQTNQGLAYDKGGELAAKGKLDEELLKEL